MEMNCRQVQYSTSFVIPPLLPHYPRSKLLCSPPLCTVKTALRPPNIERLRTMIISVNKKNENPLWKMPSARLLKRTGEKQLLDAIEIHGGQQKVAGDLGLVVHGKKIDMEGLRQVLAEFNVKYGLDVDCMPSETFLKNKEAYSVLYMIRQLGGFCELRKHFRMRAASTNEAKRKREELVECLKRHGFKEGVVPPRAIIRRLDPKLNSQIVSLKWIANSLGWEYKPGSVVRPRERGMGYFKQPGNIRSELEDIMTEDRVMPCMTTIPSFLVNAVKNYGGFRNLTYEYDWILQKEYSRVKMFLETIVELHDYLDKYHLEIPGRTTDRELPFPQLSRMHDRGYGKLRSRIAFYGGGKIFGLRLGFAYRSQMDALHLNMGRFSIPFAIDMLQYALEKKIAVYGCLGMPSLGQMEADGQNYLANETRNFGGEHEVGRRLGLIPQNMEWARELLT